VDAVAIATLTAVTMSALSLGPMGWPVLVRKLVEFLSTLRRRVDA
jgi:hypothetical protein